MLTTTNPLAALFAAALVLALWGTTLAPLAVPTAPLGVPAGAPIV